MVRSSLAAETLVMSDAVHNGVYLLQILSELPYKNKKFQVAVSYCMIDCIPRKRIRKISSN